MKSGKAEASGGGSGKERGRKRKHWKALLAGSIGLLLAILVAAGGLVAAGASGMGKGQIQAAAQRALSDFAGEDVAARFGDARLVLSGFNLVALQLSQVELLARESAGKIAAERLRFRVSLWPLLQGRVQLTGARLDGVHIAMDPSAGVVGLGGMLHELRNARGLVEPDLVARAILDGSDRIFSLFTGRPGMQIRLTDLTLDPVPDQAGDEITLSEAVIAKQSGNVAIELSGVARTTAFTASAEIRREAEGARTSFVAHADIPLFDLDLGWERANPRTSGFSTAARFALEGARSAHDEASVDFRLSLDGARLALPGGALEEGAYDLHASLQEGTGKVEIHHLTGNVGRNEFRFHGAFAPAPEAIHAKPVYRYEMVSDGSRLAPEDSPEPALNVLARIAGIFDPAEGRVTADEIGVRTTHGTILGNGALVFPGNVTPAVFLAMSATDIPVSHAKQLWPWFSAHGARRWVLGNVFGGTVRSSRITLSASPGRFGDGIPLSPEEISGSFDIVDARFNVAGDIPPVRDANGHVEFQGHSVQIGLTSGTVYMPSGRKVEGADGTLAITVVRGQPLIGALELDIAGKADAVTELSSFRPIDALRFVDLSPEEFSGTVTGHVSGLVPLQREIDRDLLDWRVALEFDSLDISRPFNGQVLTGAKGTIHVDKSEAIIEASGFLNGMPAELALVQPLQGDGPGKQDISVVMDDKVRARLLPGLNTIVSGPVKVSLLQKPNGDQDVRADLTRAELRFPWVGWRKGRGVSASMTFIMRKPGQSIQLDDVRISGEGFRLEGAITVADGAIAKAEFQDVQLNRQDSFRLSMTRQQGGYRLAIDGEKIDVRSVVKQILGSSTAQDSGAKDMPIWLTAKSSRVLGFGNEELSDVTINYMGRGKSISGLDLKAKTRNGAGFIARADETDGQRHVQMQSSDAGSILRFLNIYPHMMGGSIDLRLSGKGTGPLVGQIDARDFVLVNEPRLKSLVASAPAGGPSLHDATSGKLEVTRARFEQGFARLEKGDEYLSIVDGVLRGPEIGSTFQGTLYDADGRISMTGTFMPAYGLNRIVAGIPLFGLFLGNGRDQGLIGITYKLSGDAKAPQLTINPISAIAPGVFRNIFQFR